MLPYRASPEHFNPLTDLTPAVKRPEYGRPHVQGPSMS